MIYQNRKNIESSKKFAYEFQVAYFTIRLKNVI